MSPTRAAHQRASPGPVGRLPGRCQPVLLRIGIGEDADTLMTLRLCDAELQLLDLAVVYFEASIQKRGGPFMDYKLGRISPAGGGRSFLRGRTLSTCAFTDQAGTVKGSRAGTGNGSRTLRAARSSTTSCHCPINRSGQAHSGAHQSRWEAAGHWEQHDE